MMWHWNSLWASAPGDPPAIDDPVLYRSPWTAEQAIALQARTWEAMLSTAHSWWTLMLAAWPAGPFVPLPAMGAGAMATSRADAGAAQALLPAPERPAAATTTAKPAATKTARKRTAPATRRR